MTRRPDPQRSRAVLIGVSRYTNAATLPEIPGARANLDDLQRLLTDSAAGTFPAEHCSTVAEPTYGSQIGDAVSHAASNATDVLLVYYAGHGMVDSRGNLHLALTDSDPDQVGWTALPFGILRQEILDSPAAACVLILDCCYSGRAFEAMADQTGVIAGQVEIKGTYTITSSAANVPSVAPTGDRNTAFTGALLASATTTPGLTLDELYRDTDHYLLINGHPRPRRCNVNVAGDIVLFARSHPLATSRRHRLSRHLTSLPTGPSATVPLHPTSPPGDLSTAPSRHPAGDRPETPPGEAPATPATDIGHQYAMTVLGALFDQAICVPGEVTTWYREVVDAGRQPAMINVLDLTDAGEPAETQAEIEFDEAIDARNKRKYEMYTELSRYFSGPGEQAKTEDHKTETQAVTEHDKVVATRWLRSAANSGDPRAMTYLGRLLLYRRKWAEAEAWCLKAAVANQPEAMYDLGCLLANRDEQDAADAWFRKAHDAGYFLATFKL